MLSHQLILAASLPVITVGGSIQFAECLLSDGKTWPADIENRLGQSFHNVWINNAGMVGHSTFCPYRVARRSRQQAATESRALPRRRKRSRERKFGRIRCRERQGADHLQLRKGFPKVAIRIQRNSSSRGKFVPQLRWL